MSDDAEQGSVAPRTAGFSRLGWPVRLILKLVARSFLRLLTSEVPPDSGDLSLGSRPLQPDEGGGTAAEIAELSGGEEHELSVHLPQHVGWGTLLVVISLAVAFAGGIGFLVAYWTGGDNTLLGVALALFFGGFGFALVLWSHLLSTQIEVIDRRERLAAPTPYLSPAVDAFRHVERDVRRRGLLKWSAAAGVSILAAMFVSTLRSFSLSPDSSLYSTIWKRGQRLVTADGRPVSANSLQPGSTTIVFPEDSIGSERSQTVLIRVQENMLRLPKKRQLWAPMGNLAYSRVCTHAGCSVGMYERTTHLLMCPCHQSTFNVLDGAQPTGGPAARPLPQLPLYTDSQGFLRAAGGFTEPPGPGFWGLP